MLDLAESPNCWLSHAKAQSSISSDINKIHDGIGDKCGGFFQWFCGFLSGFIIGFIWGWKLTLVILAISPLLAGSAFVMTKVIRFNLSTYLVFHI